MKEIKINIIDSIKNSKEVSDFISSPLFDRFNNDRFTILPGFCDVHVHFREPGFSYKETILSGSKAAAKGGYCCVCTMPNLSPVPDNREHLNEQLSLIERDAVIRVIPYGSITKGEAGKELSDFEEMADDVIAFSDDGKGVQDASMMEEAMKKARSLSKMIVAHCEDNSLLRGGYIHDGRYAKEHGHTGISSESEYKQIERDLKLAEKTGCAYHVCHISTKESVELIRQAKKRGIDVSCETAPHYLLSDENDLKEDGFYKMNPPLRSKEDREALIAGILDGTIDMIATDHAPHSLQEKSKGLKDSAFGISGIEIAFPLLYSGLVKKGILSLDRLMELLVTSPCRRFRIPMQGLSIWALDETERIDNSKFLSRGKATPFVGHEVSGVNYLTIYSGKAVYQKED